MTSLVSSPVVAPCRARAVAAAACAPVLARRRRRSPAEVAAGARRGPSSRAGRRRPASATDGPEPGYRRAWRTPIAPGGPGDRFGLSAPVIAGDVAVAVGPERCVGVDLGSGEQAFVGGSRARPLGAGSRGRRRRRGTAGRVHGGLGRRAASPHRGAEASSDRVRAQRRPATPADADGEGLVDVRPGRVRSRDPGAAVATGAARCREPHGGHGRRRLGVRRRNGGTVIAVDLADGERRVAPRARRDARRPRSRPIDGARSWSSLQGDGDTQPVIVALDGAHGRGTMATRARRRVGRRLGGRPSTRRPPSRSSRACRRRRSSRSTSPTAPQRWSRRVNAAFDVVAPPPVVASETVFVTDLIGHTRALDAGTGEQIVGLRA